MSTISPPAADWDTVPDGTEWPGPDTVVLLHRPLRPGTDPSALSRFAEERWNVDPAVFEEHAKARSLNFATIPRPLRQDAKYYIWQLINHPSPGTMRHSGGGDRPAIATILTVFSSFKEFLGWLHHHDVTAFAQVTPALLDEYLLDVDDEQISMVRKYRRVGEVRRLWSARGILPQRMRLPAVPPWGGEESRDLFGRIRLDRDNRTPRIGELTMQHLLIWAIRFTEDFAEDIVAAHAEYEESRQRQLNGAIRSPEKIRTRMTAYLDRLREHGGTLPGRVAADGTLVINWRHIGRILGCAESVRLTAGGRMAIESGIPIADGAYLDTPVTGRLEGRPWRPNGITFHEAPNLARLLSTACFVIIAYLSGARPGEVLNLRRGCIERDTANDLWLMNGRHYKNAVDADGNKLPAGAPRRDPWVVVALVARAVAVLERLHPHPLLFPNRLTPHQQHLRNTKRRGKARTDGQIGRDLAKFVTWVNKECERLGRTDVILPDERGLLAASRFRRTLAWFIRRRPRGLVAASIQYGHLYTRMLQGYAGSYESGFPDEYAFEDWLYRLEILTEDAQAIEDGEHVSGPAADAYRHRVTSATRQFSGHVLTSDRQARDLLGNPLLQIHHGQGMTCVLDPAQALCRLRGTSDDPLVTPDTDDCRPQCRNIARTDRDIQHIRQHHRELAAVVDDPLAPPIRHERERHELKRLQRILDAHEPENHQ
jgi:integrase